MKYLIVGGVAGGATVAARLRRNDENAEIILFERGEFVSYANCGLPYYIGNIIPSRNQLFVQTVQGFTSRYEIDIRVNTEVEHIDTESKSVEVHDLKSGKRYKESYDKLVLSPGAEPVKPPIAGIDLPGIFTLRTVPDTDKIKSIITEKTVKRAIIVGGGFIGLEMAENFRHLDIEVDLVEMAGQVMGNLDFSMASIVNLELVARGVKLHLNESVASFESDESQVVALLKSGNKLKADIVIWSIGVRPEVKLAKDSGIKTGTTGGIKVNKYLQTSDKDIYALGDAIEVNHAVLNIPVLIPLAGPANKMGRIVADNIVYGNATTYEGSIGTGIAKVFDLIVGSTGANGKLLKREGIEYCASYTHSASHAGYYPNALPLSVKILFSPSGGKLYGAQVVGFEGVDKRIEMFSQVIKNSGTIYDLMEIEHAYAPPFSSAKDPVNIAGFVADNILKKRVKIIHWDEIETLNSDKDFLLDVRTADEYNLMHIKNAVNIPVDELRLRLDEIPQGKRVVVYCAVGLRGYVATRILMQKGFTDVSNLSGGIKTYSAATGHPLASQIFSVRMSSMDMTE